MDLSSHQSNSNYANNNGINNYGITNTVNSNNSQMVIGNSTNTKTLAPSSPINQMRVVHQSQTLSQYQNKRPSPTTIMYPSGAISSSSAATPAAFIMTPIPMSSASVSNGNSDSGNNNSSCYNDDNYSNAHNAQSTTGTVATASAATDIIISSSTVPTTNSSSFSTNSAGIITGHGHGLVNDDRVPCMITDDDRIPHSSQILADRYLLLNQIAGSSFFECVDIRTGDALTCKSIGNCYSKILSAYFRMDGDPHIKPLHKLLKASSDQTYLLLPPSLYGDLHSYVRERRRLREQEARHLFRQICKTVKSCHQQGIVLRDLKLRKFVFSDCDRTQLKFESLEDTVVLEDPDDDVLKEKIGCPAYVAPEILKPNSDFSGKAADLWSLGVILYTMLVGRYPFNDPEHSSLFAKIARCQFVIPDYLSSKARCLIKSLLQKVPKHRLTSDDILYHPWLQEDNDLTIFNNNSFSNNNFNNNSNTSNYDLSNDDQRVPELDCLELT